MKNKINSEEQGTYVVDQKVTTPTTHPQKTEDAIIDQAVRILETRFRRGPSFHGTKDAEKYLVLQAGGLAVEQFSVVMLDSQHRLLGINDMFRGTINGAAVYPREVVKAVLAANAGAVILTHNHPSGVPTPSLADINITKKIQAALRLIDVEVLDHIITAGGESYSMACNGDM